jgi:hypothetical protein
MTFGGYDHVRFYPPVVDPEVLPGPAHAGHHFVGDEKHVVPVADLADFLVVAGPWDQGGRSGPHHGLGYEGGDRIRSLVKDRSLQVRSAL